MSEQSEANSQQDAPQEATAPAPASQPQLTARALVIGCIGAVVISAASVYAALKMGSLPWPIIFVALVSLFFLSLFRKKKTNLNEVNVAHTAMSAGAMIGGGLAFTIPGIWILNPSATVEVWQILVIALCGTALGLAYTAALRKRFIEEDKLTYPIGEATANALVAAKDGGTQAKQVFGAMGFAAVYAAIRDWFGLLPTTLLSWVKIPGVTFGVLNSPMMIAVGMLIGTAGVLVWFAGGVIGDFGVVFGASSLGLWDITTGQGIKSSLGMGAMIGCGIAVIIKFIAKSLRGKNPHDDRRGELTLANSREARNQEGETSRSNGAAQSDSAQSNKPRSRTPLIPIGLTAAVVAVVLCFVLQLGPIPSVVIVLATFLTVAMSAQSVGESGINPMEVFGVMVLLVIAAFSNVPQVQLFFVAAVVAVACGLMGDVMNDFKAGNMLGTAPRAQWIAQAAGGFVGATVSALVICLLVSAYGPDAFGTGKTFVAAQAEVVATMISGIPNLTAFVIGLVVVCVLYLVGLPVITLGIGIYLPFTYSLTVLVGWAIGAILRKFVKMPATSDNIAAGFLGGESIAGVLFALAAVFL